VRTTAVAPTGVERLLGADELIVSKTDPKGIITYANNVFLRISAYHEADVIGRPHNLIRHPDMPRCVFKLLWDTIAGGEEIFAYVVNLASDGAHYWVFAHVTPTFGPGRTITGYHSNRRAPHRTAVDQVGALYRRLRETEQQFTDSREGLAASGRQLAELLAQRGQTYDELVWALTPDQ
jgi:PAS domain S-box-containing protein